MFRSGGLPVTVCLAYLGSHAVTSAYPASRVHPAVPTNEGAEGSSYSITSSPAANNVNGSRDPKPLRNGQSHFAGVVEDNLDHLVGTDADAVFRLITSSNFVGCSMGKSAGLVPRRLGTHIGQARDIPAGPS